MLRAVRSETPCDVDCKQDVLKQGRVEYNVGTAKKPKWVKRMLSLNEAWACCHEITAVSAADLNDGVVS